MYNTKVARVDTRVVNGQLYFISRIFVAVQYAFPTALEPFYSLGTRNVYLPITLIIIVNITRWKKLFRSVYSYLLTMSVGPSF